MWEPEPHSIIQAAEKAAEAGNFASAEHLLRDAARLQEASLGPRHPDLANTLNNLGIVCEMTGKPADAEQYFRRAVSIARTSLPADHPFVATSQKNLRDFCETRGQQVEQSEPEPAPQLVQEVAESEPAPESVQEVTEPEPAPQPVQEVAEPEPALQLVQEVAEPEPAPQLATPPDERPQESAIDPDPEDPEATSRKFFIRVALGALGPIAMLMVILAAGLPRLGAPELAASSPAIALDSPREGAPPPPPVSAPVETLPTPDEPTTTSREDDDAINDVVTPASTPAHATVVRASLCADLDNWSCDPADRPVPPGPLFLYTQITAQRVTTIRHRWYQDAHLRQTVELRVQPNREPGYRTYSRTVINGESAGNWRIEVRGEDGALLHEERFTVQ